jgi:CNT family concentrative nucleoside transporter
MTFGGVAAGLEVDSPEKRTSGSMASYHKEKQGVSRGDTEVNEVEVIVDEDTLPLRSWFTRNGGLMRRVGLCALVALILAWWISSTVLPATRHRWIVQTFFAWLSISIIAFRFVPNSIVTRPVEAVWIPLVERPFFALPRYARYGLGWLALCAIVMGSTFGFNNENVRLFRIFFDMYAWMFWSSSTH